MTLGLDQHAGTNRARKNYSILFPILEVVTLNPSSLKGNVIYSQSVMALPLMFSAGTNPQCLEPPFNTYDSKSEVYTVS